MKKDQFFLLAALIIVVIIIALATVNIGTRTSRENMRIFDLTKEIDLEGKSVVDFGVFTAVPGGATGQSIEDLLRFYVEANPGSDITIIVGNEDGYIIINSTTEGGNTVAIDTSGAEEGAQFTVVTRETQSAQVNCPPAPTHVCDTVGVDVGADEPIIVDLEKEGQSFFVVIVEETEEEITVATSSPPEA